MPTAIEYFKLLPKTNCKDCGQPTCLAFAMQLANQKAKIEDCPHIDSGAKDTIAEAAAPPVKTVTVGAGNSKISMGGETVLFRHERRFINPIAYALTVSDELSADDIKKRIDYIKSISFDRIGMIFKVDMISVKNDSKDASKFKAAAESVMSLWNQPFVLESDDPSAIEEALKTSKLRVPLIYGATSETFDRMLDIAKANKVPLGIKASSTQEAADLAEKAKAAGYDEIILDLGAKGIKDVVEQHTIARRAAIKKKFKPLGYPLMNRAGSGEYAVMTAVISTLKYGSLVIFDDLKNYEALPLFTLRQNIYTDPQVPIQVKQAVYPIGNPDEHSPIMFTTNFSLTYFTVRADIEKSKIPVWLQIVNTDGLSVLTAFAAGKFDADHIKAAFDESGVLEKSDGPVILPGLVSRLSGKLEEAIGRKVVVGTTESKNIPKHLKQMTSGCDHDHQLGQRLTKL